MKLKASDLVLGRRFKVEDTPPMRKLIFAALGATAMVSAFTIGQSITTTAEAQNNGEAPIILVVNQAQIVAQSKAGKSASSQAETYQKSCLLYTSPSPRDLSTSRMPSSA